jgi:hypothetical protein
MAASTTTVVARKRFLERGGNGSWREVETVLGERTFAIKIL